MLTVISPANSIIGNDASGHSPTYIPAAGEGFLSYIHKNNCVVSIGSFDRVADLIT